MLQLRRHLGSGRSFEGCWTCRLRRKKCDEKHPVCATCAALGITCHYGRERPDWMDGGKKQEEMAEQLKREVRDKAGLRRWQRPAPRPPTAEHAAARPASPSPPTARCAFTNGAIGEVVELGPTDTFLLTFYLDYLLPFVFPFYLPSPLHGGKAWILELMLGSAVVRHALLCQSSYFFSLVHREVHEGAAWQTVFDQTAEVFGVLGMALQIINGSEIKQHVHGASRVLVGIMQMQRFEIAAQSFDNCQAHLHAALELFQQLLNSLSESPDPGTRFVAVLSGLGTPSPSPPCSRFPSAEQTAFRFSTALLLVDDIVASTMLQRRPKLCDCHDGILGGSDPLINLGDVVGCQNWALRYVGQIAALDAWKQECNSAGHLDVMEMVRRGTSTKDDLQCGLLQLEEDRNLTHANANNDSNFFVDSGCQMSTGKLSEQKFSVTRVWAHAALIYLSVVVSGWQPANCDVRKQVEQVLDTLENHLSPPSLVRTVAWPFCVAGCLADPSQEARFRDLVRALQHPHVFGTVHKALEVMENVWRRRDAGDATIGNFNMWFQGLSDLVLLI